MPMRIKSPHLDNPHGYSLIQNGDATIQTGDWTQARLPVLFVPGNSGKNAQGRALASESLRQWERGLDRDQPPIAMSWSWGDLGSFTSFPSISNKTRNHPPVLLEWYLIDTNEEMSVFHGSIAERQVAFILSCLSYLTERYKGETASRLGFFLYLS